MRHPERPGFTLAELALTISLILLLSGLSVLQMRGSQGSADTKALALMVTAELRNARARAMSTRIPIGVVFPSDNASVPHSRSLYLMEGMARAKIKRGVNYAAENGAYLFVGSWAPSTLATYRKTNPVDGWPRTATRDYQIVFQPNGKVASNDLPLIQGEYHIVVGAGLAYSFGGVPVGNATVSNPPAYFTLTGIDKPVTISITPAGAVSLQTGLKFGSLPSASGVPYPPAPPIIPGSMPNTSPQFDQVAFKPAPINGTAVLELPRDSVFQTRLELTVDASDSDGDSMNCTWVSTPITGTYPGNFTVAVGQLSPARPSFTTNWYPPRQAQGGDRFVLTSTLTDEVGSSGSPSGSAAIAVTMQDSGIVLYEQQGSLQEIALTGGQGTPRRKVNPNFKNACNNRYPRISSDSQHTVVVSDQNGQWDLFTCNLNGSSPRILADSIYDVDTPTWSPSATEIAYAEAANATGAPTRILRIPANAAGNVTKSKVLRLNGSWAAYAKWNALTDMTGSEPSWSMAGDRLAFSSGQSGDQEIWVANTTGAPSLQIVAGNVSSSEACPHWSPDSTILMFLSDRDGSQQIYTLDLATLAIEQRTTGAPDKLEVCFAPNWTVGSGGEILYSALDGGGRLHLYAVTMPGTGNITVSPRDLGVSGLPPAGCHPDWSP